MTSYISGAIVADGANPMIKDKCSLWNNCTRDWVVIVGDYSTSTIITDLLYGS